MSCPCSGPYEDCEEPSDVWREKRVRTRKPHFCYECGDTIPAGSTVCTATYLFEGHWRTIYRCVSCGVYVEYISMAAKLCPLWGHVSQFVRDNDLDLPPDELPTLREWRDRESAGRQAAS